MSFNPVSLGLGAQNVTSDKVNRYAIYYTYAGEIIVARQQVAFPAAGWAKYQLTDAGARGERTAMQLPLLMDTHCYPAIVILGDGKVAIWGNMHGGSTTNDRLNMMISSAPSGGHVDITAAWTDAHSTGLPSVGPSCSYPTPQKRPDGSVRFSIRDVGISSNGDWHYWVCPNGSSTFGARQALYQGISVPGAKPDGSTGDSATNAGFVGGSTPYNWSCYPAHPTIVDNGDGTWLEYHFGVWRTFGNDYTKTSGATTTLTNGQPNITASTSTMPFDPLLIGATVTGTGIPGSTTILSVNPLAGTAVMSANFTGANTTTGTITVTQPSGAGAFSNVKPFVVVYHSVDDTWRSVTGTIVTLPITPMTTAVQTGMTATDSRGVAYQYENSLSIDVDNQGFPHMIIGHNPNYHIWWDGTAWHQAQLNLPLAAVAAGSNFLFSEIQIVRFRGALWLLGQGGPYPLDTKRIILTPFDGSTTFHLGHNAPDTAESIGLLAISPAPGGSFAGNAAILHDKEALRLRGTVEIFLPEGDNPPQIAYVLGDGAMATAV